jgi:HIV Tat-specific factor 1
MTIKFKNGISAQACIQKMDGRYFGGQRVCLVYDADGYQIDGQISAAVYTGRERFKRSGAGGLDDDDEESEQKRLDNFAHWLVDGENEEV